MPRTVDITDCEGAKFLCTECKVQIFIEYVIIYTDNKIYLIGACPQCKEYTRFDLAKVLAGLYAPKSKASDS